MRMTRRRFVSTTIAAPALLAAPALAPALAEDRLLKLRELYTKLGDMSDLAQSLEGQRISIVGFMAPPLKAESKFFVLTKMPMAVCPFCETEAEWPDNILAVYTKRTVDVIPYNVGIKARGVLDLGGYKDPETGFFSMVRLQDATYG